MNGLWCVLAALVFGAGPSTVADSATLWAACSKGDAQACYRLSRVGTVRLSDADRAAALKAPEAACAKGDAAACFIVGMHLDNDGGMPPDGQRAFERFGTACQGGFLPACSREGVFYVVSVPSREAGAKAKAAALFEKACVGGWRPACVDLVTLLGQPPRTRELEAGCRDGLEGACRLLPKKAPARRDAARVLQGWCKAGVGGACEDLKRLEQ